MLQTVKAVVNESGEVRLLEKIHLERPRHALVTILDDKPPPSPQTGHTDMILSEHALAKDWNRPEEDAAWSHL